MYIYAIYPFQKLTFLVPGPTPRQDGEPTVEVSEEAEHARMLICPRLELAQVQFMLTCPAATEEDKVTAKDTLMAAVKESNMAPFYKHLCEQYGWMEDEALTAAMQKTNAAELVKLEVRKPIKN